MESPRFLNWLQQNGIDLQTPLYVYELSSIDSAVEALQGLLPPGARIFYSLKANPQAILVRHFSERGVGAEAVSDQERRNCVTNGVHPHQVIAGGVAKSTQQLQQIIRGDFAAIVIDSLAEWQRLREIETAETPAKILLRVNPGVALGGLDMSGKSQFGMSTEQALQVACDCRDVKHVDFLGLHSYFGSQRLKCGPIVETARLMADVIDTFAAADMKPAVVNIGLGCGIPYLEKDSELPYDELQGLLRTAWEHPAWQGVDIWSEAGRFLVARSGYFITRVVDRKSLHGSQFVFLDGGLNAHNPGVGLGRLFRSNPRFAFPGTETAETEVIDLVGNLCTSADRIGHQVTAPRLEIGDLVVIVNAGAYCQTTAMWGFNSQPPFQESVFLPHGELRSIDPQHADFAGLSSD